MGRGMERTIERVTRRITQRKTGGGVGLNLRGCGYISIFRGRVARLRPMGVC